MNKLNKYEIISEIRKFKKEYHLMDKYDSSVVILLQDVHPKDKLDQEIKDKILEKHSLDIDVISKAIFKKYSLYFKLKKFVYPKKGQESTGISEFEKQIFKILHINDIQDIVQIKNNPIYNDFWQKNKDKFILELMKMIKKRNKMHIDLDRIDLSKIIPDYLFDIDSLFHSYRNVIIESKD